MQGSFSSRTYNFNTLLGRSSFPDLSVKKVVVPPFQRGYSWEKVHVATFWDDILQFHAQVGGATAIDTYFLGPIVILPTKNEVTLLDGQQRLATTTIVLGAIRDLARTGGGQTGSDLARDIQRDLIYLDDESDIYALTLNELDKGFFRESIQKDPPDANVKQSLRSHALIAQAKSHLNAMLRNYVVGKKPSDMVRALKALKVTIAERIKLVVIEVESEDEAFLIFETLNDRGLRLSVPDLLLNHLMREAKNASEREKVRKQWNVVVENVATRQVSSFLRHMWVSSYGDVKAQSLYREIKERLRSDDIDSVSFANLCAEESEQYVALLDVDKAALKNAEPYVRGILKSLGGDMALPLLLSGLTSLNEADFEKLSRTVAALIVRYAFVANLNPAPLEEILYATARDIRKIAKNQSSGKALAVVKSKLKKLDPTTKQLSEGAGELYLKKKEAQYILTEIAKRSQSPGKALAFDKISIEHIFPENSNSADWPNTKALTPFVWHVGNLTLLEPKLNKKLGTKSYALKAQGYSTSEIKLSQLVATHYKVWDENAVIDRAKKMVLIIEQVWVV